MDRLGRLKQEYQPYSSTVAWLTVLSVFLPMLAVYYETCANRFFILLSTVISLWVVEVIPMWVTAMSIPMQVILLRVMAKEDGEPLNGKEASKVLFEGMFGSVPLTLLATFCLCEALKLYGPLKLIPKKWIDRVASHSWPVLVLSCMLIIVLLSPLIGSIPAVELVMSLLSRQMESIPADSVQSRILYGGIMVAGSVGGMCSPIAGAHSIFTFDFAGRNGYSKSITWLLWISATLPIALLTILGSFMVILIYYTVVVYREKSEKAPKETDSPIIMYPLDDRSTGQLSVIVCLYLITIILWVLTGHYAEWIGELGIVSLLPIVVLFGSRLLDTTHMTRLPWHIILLAIGGSALSIAAQHSGYLQHVSSRYINNLHWSLFVLVPTFFSLYKSQFVTCLLFIPAVIASNQDAETGDREATIRFMLTFIGCSLGMALPISNMSGMVLEEVSDGRGERRLRTRDFVLFGIPSTIIGLIVTLAVGKPILEKLI